MRERLKKICAVISIIVLLPYIITIFLNGTNMHTTQIKENNYVKIQTENKILSIPLDEYCIGILAKEVTSEYEEEMLKAQAVLVRTTIYKEIEEAQGSAIVDQGFLKKNEIQKPWYEKLEQIWGATDGQVLMYQNKLALVPFHQISNGKTRDGKEVLGSEEHPYLKVKECPKDVEADAHMASKILPVSSIEILETDSAGYVTSVKVGSEICSGENFRDAYGLPSSCFEVQEWEGKMRVTTKGVGHGLGLSQYTANEMAKEKKTYQEILEYFFEGTEMKEVAEILLNVE